MKSKISQIITYILALIITAETLISLELHRQDRALIDALKDLTESLQQENAMLTESKTEADELAREQAELIDELLSQIEKPAGEQASRGGDRGERRIMEVTAYDLSIESCGKGPSHPLYGVTASGSKAQEWHTIAAGPELSFGTKVYIPYFSDKPNGGVFVVEDRGSGVGNGRIDIYIPDNKKCMDFGRQKMEVWIMD